MQAASVPLSEEQQKHVLSMLPPWPRYITQGQDPWKQPKTDEEKKLIKLPCYNCKQNTSTTCWVKCAVCPDVRLCLQCHSARVAYEGHDPGHPYYVADRLSSPLFSDDWSMGDEVRLLQGVEKHGAGGWELISREWLHGTKTAKQCRMHYCNDYLGREGQILPTYRLAKSPTGGYIRRPVTPPPADVPGAQYWANGPRGEAVDCEKLAFQSFAEMQREKQQAEGGGPQDGDAVMAEAGPAPEAPAPDAPLPGAPPAPTPKSSAQTNKAHREFVAAQPGSDLAGYMPLRDDYTTEHDDDAEKLLQDMEFSPDDDPAERELKLSVIRIYNKKLDERERRKAFVKAHGLLDYKRVMQQERRRPKEDRDLVARLRVFARFQSKEEHEEFIGGVLKARALRRRIETLQNYRRLGIRTLAEAERYEHAKRKREEEKLAQKHRETAGYLYNKQSKPADRTSRYLNRDKEGCSSMDLLGGLDTTAAAHSKQSHSTPPLDISGAPGVELLSPKERELCGQLHLLPHYYIVIKDSLIRDCYRRGYLNKAALPQLVKMEVSKVDTIYDFFVQCGWVSSEPTSA